MNIGLIIKGHVNELLNVNEDLSEKRMNICLQCPLYKDFVGGICNNDLYLNPKTNEVSSKPKDGFQRGCGCRLQAKTRLENSKCPLGKW